MLQRRKILQYHTNKYNIHMYNFRLVLYVWVLSIIGILVINSAADGFAAKQLIGFVGGSVVMIIFSLIDYKLWCFNGKCHYIWACANRDEHSTEVMTYDREWNAHPEYSIFEDGYRHGEILPKPKNLDGMIKVAEKLSEEFPCVRVDLYNVNGKIYFGELTFTSYGGMMDFHTEEFLNLAGGLVDLSNVKVIK